MPNCPEPWTLGWLNSEWIVALAALGVALYQAHAIKRHNKLSAMPFPALSIRWDDKNPKLAAHLVNKGLGPAVVLYPIIGFVDDESFDLSTTRNFATLIASTGFSGPKARMLYGPPIRSPIDRRQVTEILAPGEERQFFELSFEQRSIDAFEFLRRISFKIRYRSVYGQEFAETIRLADSPPARDEVFDADVVKPTRRL